MTLFSTFQKSDWTESADPKGNFLVSPLGHRIRAGQATQQARTAQPHADRSRIHHLFVWHLRTENTNFGSLPRWRVSPLDDLAEALSHQARRAVLLAQLEIQALTQGVPPGEWLFDAYRHRWVPTANGSPIEIHSLPNQLTALAKTVTISISTTGERILPGYQGISITVPSSRHAAMERLRALRQLAG